MNDARLRSQFQSSVGLRACFNSHSLCLTLLFLPSFSELHFTLSFLHIVVFSIMIVTTGIATSELFHSAFTGFSMKL